MSETKEKKPITIQFIQIIIQLGILIFFTITWLYSLLSGIGEFNVWYFLFMFIAICIATIITLYAKANPIIPIPKRPTQQFTNLVKAITDIITKDFGKNTPPVQELKNIIQNALIWNLRDAEINPEINQETLTKAKKYIFRKLYPKPIEENLNKEIIKKEVEKINV